jgi:hypothetical protein
MSFLLDIDYTSRHGQSTTFETLLLGEGWGGVRDVRGRYMTRPRAVVGIPSWVLSAGAGSQVRLCFGLSNRCPVDALIFSLSGEFGSISRIIQRSSDLDIILDDIRIGPDSEQYLIDVGLHNPAPENMLKFMDILAINRI